MASNFNDDSRPADPAGAEEPGGGATGTPAATTDTPLSPAVVRFRSCRWQQPIEDGGPEFCTHREVKPYAGTIAFDAEAWCPDCQYYKLRRTPKKRAYGDEFF